VILEAGLGGWSITWHEIQAELAETTRVCAYDRAGYGWSDPDPETRTAARMAEDLHLLLEQAGEPGPYVLAGLSWGAYPARRFADQHPHAVAGLVLIDPAHEDDADILPEDVRAQQAALPNIYRGFATAARLGVLRAVGPREMAAQAPFIAADVPAATADLYYTAVADVRWWETSLAELAAQEQNAAQMRALADPGTLPLVVLGAGEPPEGMGEELLAARRALLETLAATSTHGRFVVAEGSGHDIARERPALVVETIVALLEEYRE
jgi:pimeloyl-ACP methyl ester carboxylesterase